MDLIKHALVIGGGIAGMCTAIELRKRDVRVDLLELDEQWRVYGAGISLNGAALRALKVIGVLDEVLRQGSGSDGCNVCTADGTVLETLPTPRIAGTEVPGGAGILRPVLARILAQATLGAGVNVRLGNTFQLIQQQPNGQLLVRFRRGEEGYYDLVIGADGLSSSVRASFFPHAPTPRYTGQGSWRAVVPRDPTLSCATMFMGKTIKVGLNPISGDQMYLFCLESREQNTHVPKERWGRVLTELLSEFSGPIAGIRDGIKDSSLIVYRPLESLLLTPPWNRGSIVLVGDAAHATTPHLASGAALGIEDAIVLAEEMDRASSIVEGATAYAARRFGRCQMVVNNSLRLGEIEIAGVSGDEHATIMRESLISLLAPI